MSETKRLLTFDEFRASTDVEVVALRQQRQYFQDPAAAEQALGGALTGGMGGWIPWPENVSVPVAG